MLEVLQVSAGYVEVGFLDAWNLWCRGKLDQETRLWHIPILWWGRGGKLAAFIGGATILLDLIGPDRIREFGKRVQEPGRLNRGSSADALVGVIGIILATVITAVVSSIRDRQFPTLLAGILAGVVGLYVAPRIAQRVVLLVGSLLERPRFERFTRWSAYALVIAGFHFDLLSS